MPQTVTPVQVISPRCKVTAFFHSWCGSIRANEGERGSKENLFTYSSFYLCQTKDLYANCPGNECNVNTAISAAKLKTICAHDAGQLRPFITVQYPPSSFLRFRPFICDGFQRVPTQGRTRCRVRQDAGFDKTRDQVGHGGQQNAGSDETQDQAGIRLNKTQGRMSREVRRDARYANTDN